MGLVRRADVLNALSDLFEKESSGNCVDFGKACDAIEKVPDAPFVYGETYEQVM